MFGEISEEQANKMNEAWEAASLLERLRMDRVNWISTDTTSYYVTKPSKLELMAADEIERLRLFEVYANGDIEAQVEAAIEAKKLTGKYPFED